MQAKATSIAKLTKLHRPNLVTADELNPIIAELKAELSQLKRQLTELAAKVTDHPRPRGDDHVYQMSPLQASRWQAVAAARDLLKAGEAEAPVRDFLAAQYPDLGAEGILKLARVQAGKR